MKEGKKKMKVLFRRVQQSGRYTDKTGIMLVELERGDSKKAVIKEIEYGNAWFHSNTFISEVDTYEYDGTVYKGRLLVFKAVDGYTD